MITDISILQEYDILETDKESLDRLNWNTENIDGSINATVHTVSIYEDTKDALNERFPDLTIEADKEYIGFADARLRPNADDNVEKILLKANVGDGDGVTIQAMNNITKIDNIFTSTDIIKFDEFIYCTNIGTSIGGPAANNISYRFFGGCKNLKSIKLPTQITLITSSGGGGGGSGLFTDCKELEHVELPEGITEIWDATFKGCAKLTLDHLPASLTKLRTYVFSNCSNLELTTLPEGLTDIGAYAFLNCTKLNVPLSNRITTLNKDCFSGTSIEINQLPEDLQILDRAFANCVNITTLSTNNNLLVGSSGIGIFNSMTYLETIDMQNATFSNLKIMGVGNGPGRGTETAEMFYECKKLKTINLPSFNTSNITNMGGAFAGCESLTTINIDWDTSNVTNFGNIWGEGGMFANCNALETIDITNWNVSLSTSFRYMFYKCQSLKSIDISKWTFKDTLTFSSFGYMFCHCSNLESIGNFSPTIIGDYMFYNCKKLTGLDFSNVIAIGGYAFNGYGQSDEILNFPNLINGVQAASQPPFYGFQGKEIHCPNAIKWNINGINYNFCACPNLEVVEIGPMIEANGATWSPYYTFAQCPKLVRIIIGQDSDIDLDFGAWSPLAANINLISTDDFNSQFIIDIVNKLKDLTGLTQKTLSLSTTIKNKLTQSTKDQITAKNWKLA